MAICTELAQPPQPATSGLPLIFSVASRLDREGAVAGSPYLYLGVPTIAELSTLHGMVPPHPGPLIAVAGLHADLGTTILVGLVCAVPRIVAGRPGIRRPDATVLRAASTGRR